MAFLGQGCRLAEVVQVLDREGHVTRFLHLDLHHVLSVRTLALPQLDGPCKNQYSAYRAASDWPHATFSGAGSVQGVPTLTTAEPSRTRGDPRANPPPTKQTRRELYLIILNGSMLHGVMNHEAAS